MWFDDLMIAIDRVYRWLGDDAKSVCIDKVTPCADGGIVFMLSDHSRVKWFNNGTVVRREEGSWRQPPADTPTCGYMAQQIMKGTK